MTALGRSLLVLTLSLGEAAWAAEQAAPGVRIIGGQTYVLDSRGHTIGTIREAKPGTWHQRDNRGQIVRTITVPPGCPPFGACPGARK